MSERGAHWAELGENTFVAGIWLLYGIERLLGRRLFRCCLYPVVLAYWLGRPDVRAQSRQYLDRLQAATGALGRPARRRDTFFHLLTFADTLLDKLLAVAGRYPLQRVRTLGAEPILAAIRAGQGGVIVTAHVGCLELCRALAERTETLKLTVLVHTRHAEQFNRVLRRLNPDTALTLLEVSELGPATAVMLAERVEAGEYVVIAGDRVPVGSGQTVTVPFLGHDAAFPVGPYLLASLFKCPLYLLGCLHDGEGYALHFELLAGRVVLPRQQRQQALAAQASRYAGRLGALLAASPYDWFNFFPFWEQKALPHAVRST
ncbi:hypothetical protein GCM10027202_04360 [Microvirgula curvata]|uniref:LpxL/LpxP family acyltransferase n=1 Tax=Microvirgula TaxID=57479 RepID=UPI000DC27EAD|nr:MULTISPECIES: acyltransferase [Microvirgula]RAS15494.1 putative LPLAT superfamily acyltransferase [Microvirgula sp. AG722]